MKQVTDLFDPEPPQWGLRGDPWVWRAMSTHLTGTYLPPSIGEVERLLLVAFDRVVGVNLSTETQPWVYRPEFARDDGLSSGNVDLNTWRATLLPLLIDRARQRLSG
ncbi:MAG: hypothetical protein ABW046_02245 [Actinoplanes sp.]